MNVNLESRPALASSGEPAFEHRETREVVSLVLDAAERVALRGEAAFREFRVAPSHWRRGDFYVFVLDPRGRMLVHPDPALEGKEVMDLRDVGGRPIIRGLIDAVQAAPDKPEGWYHYEWPMPDGLMPRWKSSFVRMVTAPSRERYIVGCGIYSERMERAFVVDMVQDAVALIEKWGRRVFPLLHDPRGPFLAKDAYVFVYDSKGRNLVLPPFPHLEGRDLIDLRDTAGKLLVREMLALVQSAGAGWVDYFWPKPGESVSTQKSAYVSMARLGDGWVLVGSGVYLSDAPRASRTPGGMRAPELIALVREAAALLQRRGERAYDELRRPGSKWFHGETYFFVMNLDGRWTLHAAEPQEEGKHTSRVKDSLGRPIAKMILEAASSPDGEGWAHYMYPRPRELFPTWKSVFVKRVTFPSGARHVVCCGIYDMLLDRAFIADVVQRAAAAVAERGTAAFGSLRDPAGPFVLMDNRPFVLTPGGTALVGAGLPGLEGKNLTEVKDLAGREVVREGIAAAMAQGSAWVDFAWFRPGEIRPGVRTAFLRRVEWGGETYIVGSGAFLEAVAEEGPIG